VVWFTLLSTTTEEHAKRNTIQMHQGKNTKNPVEKSTLGYNSMLPGHAIIVWVVNSVGSGATCAGNV